MEEEYVQQLCEDLIRLRPDVVITEKGISGGAGDGVGSPRVSAGQTG